MSRSSRRTNLRTARAAVNASERCAEATATTTLGSPSGTGARQRVHRERPLGDARVDVVVALAKSLTVIFIAAMLVGRIGSSSQPETSGKQLDLHFLARIES